MKQVNALTLADAEKVINAIRTELEKDNLGAAVVVADEHGEPIMLIRTDGCPLPSITIALNKAYTAARQRVESREVGDDSRRENFPLTNFGELRYTGWGGGVPLVYEGEVVGAVAVSGLPEEKDMELARMAAKLIG